MGENTLKVHNLGWEGWLRPFESMRSPGAGGAREEKWCELSRKASELCCVHYRPAEAAAKRTREAFGKLEYLAHWWRNTVHSHFPPGTGIHLELCLVNVLHMNEKLTATIRSAGGRLGIRYGFCYGHCKYKKGGASRNSKDSGNTNDCLNAAL